MRSFILLIWLFSLTASVADAAIIRLVEDGDGRYRLEAEGFVDVAAIDLTIEYDPASLSVSSVTQGALLQSVMFASNLNQPGLIRIGVVTMQSVNGGGDLAALSTVAKTDAPQFKSITARLNSAGGGSLAVKTYLPSPTLNEIEPEPIETDPRPNRLGGSVVGLPADSAEPSNRHRSSADQGYGFSGSSQHSVSGPRMTFVELREYAASSPRQQMRAYHGARTFDAMSKLFVRSDKAIRQHPYPAPSDGETEVDIILPALHSGIPNLALSNAKLLRSGVADSGEWIVSCLPTAGASSAKILVLGLDQLVEIPVVVASVVDTTIFTLDADGTVPEYDINADGYQNWLDDYILMVNLLQKSPQD